MSTGLRSSLIIILSCLCLHGFSQVKELLDAAEKLQNDPVLIHGTLGLCLYSVDSSKTLAELNGNKAMVPASTLKALTTAAALSTLGENFRFKTHLQYTGKIDSTGTLDGNIFIVGGGDPSLGSEIFYKTGIDEITSRWAEAVKKLGIKKIKGKVIADASIFETSMEPPSWRWLDLGNYFGSGACGLSFGDNTVSYHFQSGTGEGATTKVTKTTPHVHGLEIINEVVSGPSGSGDQAFVYGSAYSMTRYLRGSIPQNRTDFTIKGSIPDPPLFCAQELSRVLEKYGIKQTGKATTLRKINAPVGTNYFFSDTRTAIDTVFSPPLKEIVYWTNMKSLNLYAEHLMKYLGLKLVKSASHEGGIKALKDFWKSKGVDVEGLYLADGSGLSRLNGITPKQQATLLAAIHSDKSFNVFESSLPVAGQSGSLKNLCKGTAAEDNLRAKSGYINRARGYTGYVRSKSGELLSFSLLSNNFDCYPATMKKKLEKLMILMAGVE